MCNKDGNESAQIENGYDSIVSHGNATSRGVVDIMFLEMTFQVFGNFSKHGFHIVLINKGWNYKMFSTCYLDPIIILAP